MSPSNVTQELFETIEASQKLYTTLDPKEVMTVAFGLVSRLLSAGSLVIALKEAGGKLRVFSLHPKLTDPQEAMIEGKDVAQLRVPYEGVVLSDYALEDFSKRLQVNLGNAPEAILCPLEVEGHPFGFMAVARSASSTPWGDPQVERAIVVSRALAQAMENAWFHRQLAKFSDESLAMAYEKLKAAYDELQHMQQQLLDTEKLNVVGKLASSVAHQLRNPLGVIKASAQLLLSKVKPGEGPPTEELLKLLRPDGLLRERLEAIQRNVIHADTIIGELLQVARPKPTDPLKPTPVHDVLNESARMMESKFLDAGVALKKDYGELPSVMASPHHLQQVFMNFMMNSVEAMTDKGSVAISAKTEGQVLKVSFTDTGSGFTPDALKQLAKPFFTTKPHGVGLGMYTAKQILEAHGAVMDVQSEVGKGTTITISLPIAPSTK